MQKHIKILNQHNKDSIAIYRWWGGYSVCIEYHHQVIVHMEPLHHHCGAMSVTLPNTIKSSIWERSTNEKKKNYKPFTYVHEDIHIYIYMLFHTISNKSSCSAISSYISPHHPSLIVAALFYLFSTSRYPIRIPRFDHHPLLLTTFRHRSETYIPSSPMRWIAKANKGQYQGCPQYRSMAYDRSTYNSRRSYIQFISLT